MKPTYSSSKQSQGKRGGVHFEVPNLISHPKLSTHELARAIYRAAADSNLNLSELTSEDQVYQTLLERINQSAFIIRE